MHAVKVIGYMWVSGITVIASILHSILTFNDGLCSGNQTEISLLSILTLTLFVSSFILLYYIDKHQSNWREKSHIIIPTIVISSISYLIQYGIAFHIFQSYSTTCIMTNALVQLSFHLFAIWISMYSVITIGIVTLICSKTSGCNITINIHPSIPLTFIFISSLGIISSILHFVLVKNDLCPGNNAKAISLLIITVFVFAASIWILIYIDKHWLDVMNASIFRTIIPVTILLSCLYIVQYSLSMDIYINYQNVCSLDNIITQTTNVFFFYYG
eukprot:74399_1